MTLIALPDGYGEAVLGLAPGADPIRAARHELEALRPDVLVLDAAARRLPGVCAPAGEDPAGWPDWAAPDAAAAMAPLRETAAALRGQVECAVALPAPWSLATALAGGATDAPGRDPDAWEELLDLVTFAVIDAAAAAAPCAVVLRECTAGIDDPAAAAGAWQALARRLAHERRDLYIALDGESVDGWLDALAGASLAGVLVEVPPAGVPAAPPVALVVRPGAEPTRPAPLSAIAVDTSSPPEQARALAQALRG